MLHQEEQELIKQEIQTLYLWRSDITDPTIFAQSYTTAIDALTANGAKGVVTSVPYITGLSHFTTVPFNPLSANDPAFGPQILL